MNVDPTQATRWRVVVQDAHGRVARSVRRDFASEAEATAFLDQLVARAQADGRVAPGYRVVPDGQR